MDRVPHLQLIIMGGGGVQKNMLVVYYNQFQHTFVDYA
jgi:hypothetical protein